MKFQKTFVKLRIYFNKKIVSILKIIVHVSKRQF